MGKPEETEDKTIIIGIEFEKPLKLTDEEFDELIQLIEDLDFYLANGGVTQVANYIGYKEWIVVDEYANDDGDKLFIDYVEVWVEGESKYYIKDILFEKNIQEILNEVEE